MRIAMIGQKGIPASYGGVEKAVEELAARLVERGHEVTVFNQWRPGPKPRAHRGIRLRYVPAFGGKHLRNLTQSLAGTLAASVRRFDIVHFHALGPCLASPVAKVAPGSRVVVTLQGRDDRRAKWSRPAQAVLTAAAWMSANVPDGRIAVSRQLQREYAEEFGRDTLVIPNGVSLPELVPLADDDPLETFGLEPGRYVLNVGRLVPEKALDQLVAAYADVPGDVPLVIVGGSSHTDDYVARLRELAGPDRRVVLTGPIYGGGKDRLFRNATAFVTPSLLEGLPLALLEAVSYGLPIVVSDIEPHLEVVGSDGAGHRVVPVGDQAALSQALTKLLADPPGERQGADLLRERVMETFSWDRIAERTEALYEALLADAPTPELAAAPR